MKSKDYGTVSTVIAGYTTTTEPYRNSIYGEVFLIDSLKIGPGVKNVYYQTHPKGYFSGIKRPGVTLTTHLHVIPKFNDVKKVNFTVGCSSSHLTLHKLVPEDKKVLWDITLCRVVIGAEVFRGVYCLHLLGQTSQEVFHYAIFFILL